MSKQHEHCAHLLPLPHTLGATPLYYYSLPQSSSLPIAYKYTSCRGSEYNMLDCSHSCPSYYYCYYGCSHFMDIGVKCSRRSNLLTPFPPYMDVCVCVCVCVCKCFVHICVHVCVYVCAYSYRYRVRVEV